MWKRSQRVSMFLLVTLKFHCSCWRMRFSSLRNKFANLKKIWIIHRSQKISGTVFWPPLARPSSWWPKNWLNSKDSVLKILWVFHSKRVFFICYSDSYCSFLQTIKIEEDPFVPTLADLAGFWDMVYIQVEHIHELFAELAIIRENGWKRPEVRILFPNWL